MRTELGTIQPADTMVQAQKMHSVLDTLHNAVAFTFVLSSVMADPTVS